MTPEQLALVRRTAAAVEDVCDECASCFYGRLFELHPPARQFFADDLLAQQGTLRDEILERRRRLQRTDQAPHAIDFGQRPGLAS